MQSRWINALLLLQRYCKTVDFFSWIKLRVLIKLIRRPSSHGWVPIILGIASIQRRLLPILQQDLQEITQLSCPGWLINAEEAAWGVD